MAPKRNGNPIGVQIREARKDNNWTQNDLAQRVNLSCNMIGRYERGTDVPTLETLPLLLAVLELPLRVGDFTVVVTPNAGVELPQEAKQFRLDYEQEYICAAGADTSLKIRPGREGVVITAERTKSA